MKISGNLIVAGMVAALCCSVGNAQVIYSNAFNGGAVNINGTAPTVANNYAGGSSSATWSDALGIYDTNSSGSVFFGKDGSVPGTSDSLLLPFTPVAGYVYTLTASVTFTGNPGNWIGLGFAQNYSANVPTGYGRFSDSGNGGPSGQDWMILNENNGNVQTFEGKTQIFSQNGFFTSGTGTHTVKVVLDTSATLWSESFYVDGVQAGTTYTYAANPTIGAVGITETTLGSPASVRWNYLTLEAAGEGPTATVNPNSVLVPNFQGWGTSLQWWANVVGGYPNRTNYINLIFNTLKLNIARYEIGAGQNPAITNSNTPYRADMQGFELTNGVWNWNADLNQRWVLQQAEANGANLVEAFAVSPPWWMCVSSNVDGNMAGTNNLQVGNETNFAIYLATVISNLTVLDGDHFDYVIPFNEPSLGTPGQETNGYETCHMSNDQQQRVINDLRTQLNAYAPSVGIDAPGDFDGYEAYVDLAAYSPTTLGNVALFSTHTYIQNGFSSLSSFAASKGRRLWVAEYGDRDSTGLTMAQHIHDDITGLKASAWIYWMAVNSDVGNAFLLNALQASNTPYYHTNYVIYEKFYVMGQYSEFIRPGYNIISVSDAHTLAALDPTNSTLVLVTVNTNTAGYNLTYDLSGFGSVPWVVSATQTASGENMAALPGPIVSNQQFTAAIPAQSVTTFVLTTNGFPTITNQFPAAHTNVIQLFTGQSPPTFSVSAAGVTPLYYQWWSNSVAVAGATNVSYSPASLPTSGQAEFYCTVSNLYGASDSTNWLVSVVPEPTAPYPRAVLALDPVGYWRLNEAEQGGGDDGVIAWDYAGGNNGIYTNVLLGQPGYSALTDPTQTSARFGYVASQDSCAYGISGPDFSLPSGSAAFSVAAWVYPTGANGVSAPTVVAKGDYSQEEYALDAGAPNNSFRFLVRNAAGATFSANSTLSLTNSGQWYYLVGVCDQASSIMRLYTNGVFAVARSMPQGTGIFDASQAPMTIGSGSSDPANGYDLQFPGDISDVAIYNYALSPSQVQTLYQSGVSLPPSGLMLTNMAGNQAELNWNYGTLQTATNVAGPYMDVTNVVQPYTIPLTNSQQFFRIREN